MILKRKRLLEIILIMQDVWKHTLMKIKWVALKTQDNEAYNEVEDYEKIANVLEEVFGKEKQICQ